MARAVLEVFETAERGEEGRMGWVPGTAFLGEGGRMLITGEGESDPAASRMAFSSAEIGGIEVRSISTPLAMMGVVSRGDLGRSECDSGDFGEGTLGGGGIDHCCARTGTGAGTTIGDGGPRE